MRHEDRRKEAGKMFIDIAKYAVTAGILGNLLSDKITPFIVLIIIISAITSFIIGLITIPPKKEVK